jgi:dolichol-phosphate mannosyltransferase
MGTNPSKLPAEARLHFTLLMPAYNEEERIESTLNDYADFFGKHFDGTLRLMVVLNGCRDATLEVVKSCAAKWNQIEVIEFTAPIGKGGALIEGLKHAPETDIIGYTDADGSTPPSAMLDLLKMSNHADGVIGSRWLPGAILKREQTLTRRFASRVFHRIVHWLFHLGFQDTQCPAKVFRKGPIMEIHKDLMIADLAFDVNLLYLLKRGGFKVNEVPTEWADKLGSKVTQTLFRSSLTMLLSIIRLRLVYSPLRFIMPWLRPLETYLYKKLRAPFIVSHRKKKPHHLRHDATDINLP